MCRREWPWKWNFSYKLWNCVPDRHLGMSLTVEISPRKIKLILYCTYKPANSTFLHLFFFCVIQDNYISTQYGPGIKNDIIGSDIYMYLLYIAQVQRMNQLQINTITTKERKRAWTSHHRTQFNKGDGVGLCFGWQEVSLF